MDLAKMTYFSDMLAAIASALALPQTQPCLAILPAAVELCYFRTYHVQTCILQALTLWSGQNRYWGNGSLNYSFWSRCTRTRCTQGTRSFLVCQV